MREEFQSLDRSYIQTCDTSDFDVQNVALPETKGLFSVRGAGRSIAPSYFDKDVHVLKAYSSAPEITEYDEQTGRVRVSASMFLSDLYLFLISRGWTLRGMPSYPGVSIGGCVAANVHGQNHFREGGFKQNVESIEIFHPDHGRLKLSRNQDQGLFDLTIGGFGVTGVILFVTLKPAPASSNVLQVNTRPVGSILDAHRTMVSECDQHDYFHTWCDWLNASPGKDDGYVSTASFDPNAANVDEKMGPYLRGGGLWKHPVNIFGSPALRFINKLYYLKSRILSPSQASLSSFIFPSKSRLYYFNMFGKKGLFEHQMLIPHDAVDSYIRAFKSILLEDRPFVSLFHFKLFGGQRAYLNFEGEGFCLGLHLRNDQVSHAFMDKIDDLNDAHGCITNLVKDSRINPDHIRSQYQNLEEFVSAVDSYDPDRRIRNPILNKIYAA